ncbi:hypothetical protein V1517DRAFT_175158 [Lipomyces orientalis]|uniref:Uncharacterized protein n=1 Tax=Lipomyces orientalis TaxID=1233043 RepID=A0ACC3TJM5_9ASCO
MIRKCGFVLHILPSSTSVAFTLGITTALPRGLASQVTGFDNGVGVGTRMTNIFAFVRIFAMRMRITGNMLAHANTHINKLKIFVVGVRIP